MARWAQVKEVLASYLEARTTERAELKAKVRAADPSLAREVESILASWNSDSSFLESHTEVERPALPEGARLGPYEIQGVLGTGGMGEVYRARDLRLDREVALKVLPARLTDVPSARSRLEREARAVAALSHPNILALHDFSAGPPAYAVTELLVGETLRDRLARGALEQEIALRYALHIAEGLASAHLRGIIHRDLKPGNIFITTDDHVKILDFGLAKQLWTTANDTETQAATIAGTIMGTVGYMAPEQVRGEDVGPASDVFSFGAVVCESLNGAPAFRGASPAETLAAVLRDSPAGIERLPPGIRSVVRRCLQKRPDQRFASGAELRDALRAVRTTKTHSPKRGVWLALLAVILGATLALTASWAPTSPVPSEMSPEPSLLFRRNATDGAEYARIPAGSFRMGCAGESDCPAEAQATIEIRSPYWLMRTEVTAEQYLAFVGATGREVPVAPIFNPDWQHRTHPINNVTWFDARDYCAWAGGRLPSDAEWERAARATHDWRFEWGPGQSPMIEGRPAANLRDEVHLRKYGLLHEDDDAFRGYEDGYSETAPVASFPANDFGLYDMTGNIGEWVADKGLDTPGLLSQPRDGLRWIPRDGRAWEAGEEVRRVLRPSNWQHGSSQSLVYKRLVFSPYGKASVTGFRCARDSRP